MQPTYTTLQIEADGGFPGSSLPLVHYRQSVDGLPSAGIFEALFAAHHWGNSWVNGVYPFHHYHSTAHEVLGVVTGWATVQLGGPKGPIVRIGAGDAVLIPAGVAHCRIDSAHGFTVVGAYPHGQSPDLCRGRPGERPGADRQIAAVPLPRHDPVLGELGAFPLASTG